MVTEDSSPATLVLSTATKKAKFFLLKILERLGPGFKLATDAGDFLPGSDFVVGDDGDGVNEVIGRVPGLRAGPADFGEELKAAFTASGIGHPTSFGQKKKVVEKVESLPPNCV